MRNPNSSSFSRNLILFLFGLALGLGTLLAVVLHRDIPGAKAELDRSLLLASDLQDLFAGVAEVVRPSVVFISYTKTIPIPDDDDSVQDFPRGRRELRQKSLGSGVIIDRRGYILTNNHVIGDSESLEVRLWDGHALPARVVEKDGGADIALLKVEAENLREALLGNSDDLKVGHWVLAIGSPFGLTQTVSAGIVSAVGRSGLGILPYEGFIQTDASINQGNSGGPLVDLRGKLVGINTAIFSNASGLSTGIGFAVPVNLANALVQKWIQGKSSNYLGIKAARIDQDGARYFGIEKARGALVEVVMPGSPAERGGLKEKDILVSFNQAEIRDENHFRVLLAQAVAGQPIAVEVLRPRKGSDLERIALVLTLRDSDLAALPHPPPAAESPPRTRMLGITVAPLTEEIARQLAIPEVIPGVAVIDVDPNSPADSKGIREGDIIVELNDHPVKDIPELRAALDSKPDAGGGPSDVVLLRIIRYGENIGYKFLPR